MEALRVNLPCPCGALAARLIHFEVIDLMYESPPGQTHAIGDYMPEEFPEREFEFVGLADPCPECDRRDRIVIQFKNRRIVNIKRAPGMPIIEAPSISSVPESLARKAILAHAGIV